MVYKEAWLQNSYFGPMSRNIHRAGQAYIRLNSEHCEHCAGQPGSCSCSKCPRKDDSKCSPSILLSSTMSSILQLLGKVSQEASDSSSEEEEKNDHCTHCRGLLGGCVCEDGCFLPKKAKRIAKHSAMCNECVTSPITGDRYRCSVCPDYDQCSDCYEGQKLHLSHAFYLISRPGKSRELLEPRTKHCSHCRGLRKECQCENGENGCPPLDNSQCAAVHRVPCVGCSK